jgi:sugar diacid utilization regulator
MAFPLVGGGASQAADWFRNRGTIAILGERGRTAIVIVQDVGPEGREDQLQQGVSQVVGVGLARSGLGGARLSIVDAERALELSRRRGEPSRFEENWLEATILSHEETLAPVLKRCTELARLHPHLAEAVRAFAAADLSLAEAARRLYLTPNSVRHRLNRWKLLSGLNPWTLKGIMPALIALEVCEFDS